jgi:hypothetical protein
VRSERQAREDLQVRLAAVARATKPAPRRADTLHLMEQRLLALREDLSKSDEARAARPDDLSDAERRLSEIRERLLETQS